jgi:hypothetical protein
MTRSSAPTELFSCRGVYARLRLGTEFTAVVFSDSAGVIVRHPQIARFGLDRAVATDLREAAYRKVAEALGCHGEFVTHPADLRPALQRAPRQRPRHPRPGQRQNPLPQLLRLRPRARLSEIYTTARYPKAQGLMPRLAVASSS